MLALKQHCDGSEATLLACPSWAVDITCTDHAGVTCGAPPRKAVPPSMPSAIVSLQDTAGAAPRPSEGRLVVFLEDTWRPVAAADPTALQAIAGLACLDLVAANVTATSTANNTDSTTLSPAASSAVVSATSTYAGEEPKKWAITCTGNEASLANCHHKTVEGGAEVEVSCGTGSAPATFASAVRLMNGSTSYEGRVEVLRHGEWRSVCSSWKDALYGPQAFFNDVPAGVICRQLGKSQGKADAPNAFGLPPILQDPPVFALAEACTDRESSLAECPWRTDVACADYAAVTCT
ncbi:hypothetical protein ABPG75_007033 [Micractinium tetrahymenae]